MKVRTCVLLSIVAGLGFLGSTGCSYEIGKDASTGSQGGAGGREGLNANSSLPEEGSESTREDQVRAAFNSPFRPFVLASTSVGQEGLDFHHYCHSIWHWNLPSNPVDLEQREGRIHRFKGHVIRKNVAESCLAAANLETGDPWDRLFEDAVKQRSAGHSEMVPFWIHEGPHKILRHIPMYPLSRDHARYDDLIRTLALYRMVFGQPRQEDLLKLLQRQGIDATADMYRIDLSPRAEKQDS